MPSANPPKYAGGALQFSLLALFGYVTICSILAALSALTGIAAGICLMLMALALEVKNGPAALAMLVLASLAADLPLGRALDASVVFRQAIVMLAAFALCFWRRIGRP